MTNDRYVSAAERFEDGNFYEAPAVGNFNPSANPFGAYVLFYFLGEYQDSGLANNPPTPMFLWGNHDTANDTGWSLEVGVNPLLNATGPALLGNIGTGGATHTIVYPLTTITPFAGGSGMIERLILLEMWQDETKWCMAVNGTIAGVDSATGDTHLAAQNIAPSALKARLGQDPDGSNPAGQVGIVSCGFFNGLTGVNSLGSQIGQHFRNARAALQGAPIAESLPVFIDWTHRYEAGTLFAQYNQLFQNPGYAVLDPSKFPPAPPVWPDVSLGKKITNQAPVPATHVDLVYGGSSVLPFFNAIKNPDMYDPSASTAWIPNEPA